MRRTRAFGCLAFYLLTTAITVQAQSPTSMIIVAPREVLVYGEQTQLVAAARDDNGIVSLRDPFNWQTSNPSVISVDANGLATARGLGTAVVTASQAGLRSDVTMQVIPLRIDILADRYEISVGDRLQMTAVARDITGGVIPNASFRWDLLGANGFSTRAAAVSSTGLLTALFDGLITVRASVTYGNFNEVMPAAFIGYSHVLIKPAPEFRLQRLLANDPITRPLRLRPPYYDGYVATNESGQIAFIADLDGLSSAVMRYDNGRLDMLMSAGTPAPSPGSVITSFDSTAINNRGDVLVHAGGGGLLLINQAGVTPVLVEFQSGGGFERFEGISITRYSLNDNGDILFRANYSNQGKRDRYTGLFKLTNSIPQLVWSSGDPLPSLARNYQLGYFGLDRNGIVYFTAYTGDNVAIFRVDGQRAPVKLVGIGDTVSGAVVSNMTAQWGFGMSSNGNIVYGVRRRNAPSAAVLYRAGESAPRFLDIELQFERTVAVNNSGDLAFAGNAGAGSVLGFYRRIGNTNEPLLVARGPDGSKTLIEGATIDQYNDVFLTAQGTVYGQIKTTDNDFMLVQADTRRVVLKAGLSLTLKPNLDLLGFVPGAGAGPPHITTGGGNRSIYEFAPQGLTPVFVTGDRPERDVRTYPLSIAAKSPSGDLYFAVGSGIYKYSSGRTEKVTRLPFSFSKDASRIVNVNSTDGTSNFAANTAGLLVFGANTDDQNVLVSLNRGFASILAGIGGADPTTSPAGGVFDSSLALQGGNRSVAIDEQGRVMAYFNVRNGPSGLFLYENGRWQTAALLKDLRLDGFQVSNMESLVASNGKFIAQFDVPGSALLAEYAGGGRWTSLVKRDDVLPNGRGIDSVGGFAVNGRGDIAFMAWTAGGLDVLLRTADGLLHFVYGAGQTTEAGDIFPNPDGRFGSNFDLDLRDDRSLYFIATTINDQRVLYLASPLSTVPTSTPGSITFSIPDRGGVSLRSSGTLPATVTGYASIQPAAGMTAPSGLAIFGLRQSGVLVTEASVAASPLMQSGRIYAEINGPVNTGLAIANPNSQPATISFFFTDANGNSGSGAAVIPANGQIAKFLNEAPFNGPSSLAGTFTFSSSLPVSVIALRGLTNERSEFLITTLLVADLNAATATGTVVFPHFADGGGWTTQIVLVNPSDGVLSGTIQFLDQSGRPAAMTLNSQSDSVFAYAIPARSSQRFRTSGAAGPTLSGSVRVAPAANTRAPSGLAIFSFRNNGITVSEAGVPAAPMGMGFRLYAEASASIQTGVAVANVSANAVTVTLEVTKLDGSSTGMTGTLTIAANGQTAVFLDQIQGLGSLSKPFQGTLRLSSSSSISVIGLRARYNERNDFLITTTPPANEADPVPPGLLFFPHIADSGGYTTQFILFSARPGSPSSGAIQFLSQSGTSLNLTVQ